jgi:hypothetical protein
VVLETAELQTTQTDTPRVQQVGDACSEPMADGTYRQLLCVHSFADNPVEEQRRRIQQGPC